jgi:hypothetical protein
LNLTFALPEGVEEGPGALEEVFGGLALVGPEGVLLVLDVVEGEQGEVGSDLGQLPSLVARVLSHTLPNGLPHFEPRHCFSGAWNEYLLSCLKRARERRYQNDL